MNTYGLEPLDLHNCYHCQHIYYEMGKGYACSICKSDDLKGIRMYETNDCGKWKSPYESDYRRRPDLESKTKKESGQLSLF